MTTQHDQTKISTMRKPDRTRHVRLLDKPDISHLDMSLASSYSPKRKVQTSRMSMMPPSSVQTSRMSMMPPPSVNASVANLRKMELENNNLEMELIYSEYVASYAEMFLEEKLLEDTETSFNVSMKKLFEETKSLQESCKAIETRIKDIKALSCLSDYVDSLQLDINNFKAKQKKHEVNEILSQLEKLLNRFNILRCENIVLPNTEEELKEFRTTLLDCQSILQKISDPIRCDALENVTTNYQEFTAMFQEISNIKKIVEEKICNLQSEVLKTCSHALSEE